MKRFLRGMAESMYALVVMIAVGKWAIYMAYLERGYEAIGGEYCLMIMAYWVAWKIIHYLFDALEDWDYERKNKKKRKLRNCLATRLQMNSSKRH